MPVKTLKGDESLIQLHQELIKACDAHGATLNFAASDINLIVDDCSAELEQEIRENFVGDGKCYSGAQIFRFGSTIEIS
jgi:hypothetical protein